MNIKKSDSLPVFLVGLILLFVAFILSLAERSKKTKQSLAEYYHIDRRTLSNWIEHFQTDIRNDDWNRKKELTTIEWQYLKSTFGDDVSLVSNKKSLVAITESSYKTLSETVKSNLSKIGITLAAWETCSCFPPKTSNIIIKIMDGEYDKWVANNKSVIEEIPEWIYFNHPPSSPFLPSQNADEFSLNTI